MNNDLTYEGLSEENIINNLFIKDNGVLAGALIPFESVKTPKFVKGIGTGAFRGTGLEEVELNEGITRIGADAFRNNFLHKVDIPSSVTIIDDGAFLENPLEEITFNLKGKKITVDLGNHNNINDFEIKDDAVAFSGTSRNGSKVFYEATERVIFETTSQKFVNSSRSDRNAPAI